MARSDAGNETDHSNCERKAVMHDKLIKCNYDSVLTQSNQFAVTTGLFVSQLE